MSLYRIEWTETWLRTITADIDEDDLRYWAEVPIGPIPARTIEVYLDEDGDNGYPWHPQTMPDRNDEFYDLDVNGISAPVEVAS